MMTGDYFLTALFFHRLNISYRIRFQDEIVDGMKSSDFMVW